MRALRGIPPDTYNNLDQVVASISIVDDSDEIRDSNKAVGRGPATGASGSSSAGGSGSRHSSMRLGRCHRSCRAIRA
jgi:hypothetical protein